MRLLYLLAILALFSQCQAQKAVNMDTTKEMAIPYHQIPEYPDNFEVGNVAGRMIDGLGYRYYWATKDLRPEDLAHQPSPDAQTVEQTITHLYGLSETVLNTVKSIPNIRPANFPEHTFEERRAATLRNLKMASDLIKGSKPKDLENNKVIFQRGENTSEFPFWNLLNGPLADAIYHTGQLVSFRRTTGNPVQTGVNVFRGKTKE